MEITDKDVELIDNYLDGSLSEEEEALFHIRMQDDEFAGFVKFQKHLKEELYPSDRPTNNTTPLGYEVNLHRRLGVARQLSTKLWFALISTLIVVALLAALLLR